MANIISNISSQIHSHHMRIQIHISKYYENHPKSTSVYDDDDDGKKIVNFYLILFIQSNVVRMYANRHNQTRNNLKIVLRTHARSMMIEYAICSKTTNINSAGPLL